MQMNDLDNQSDGDWAEYEETLGWSNAHIVKEFCNLQTMKNYSMCNNRKKLLRLKDCLLLDSTSSLVQYLPHYVHRTHAKAPLCVNYIGNLTFIECCRRQDYEVN